MADLNFRDQDDPNTLRTAKGSEKGGPRTVEGNLVPMGFEAIVALNAAAALTVPDGARIALLQAENDDLRWRDDGVHPTAAVGMFLEAGRDFFYTGDLSLIEFIETVGGGSLNVSYYK